MTLDTDARNAERPRSNASLLDRSSATECHLHAPDASNTICNVRFLDGKSDRELSESPENIEGQKEC
jgi:hypothetical protein